MSRNDDDGLGQPAPRCEQAREQRFQNGERWIGHHSIGLARRSEVSRVGFDHGDAAMGIPLTEMTHSFRVELDSDDLRARRQQRVN